jgi:hypothetical protein
MPVTPADLRPGDQMFCPIGGAAGALIGGGQIIVAPWKHQLTWKTWWRIRHTATVTRAAGTSLSDGIPPLVAQAMPPVFEEVPLRPDQWNDQYVFVRPPWRYPGQGEDVAGHAREMASRRIPYGWLNYPRISAHRLHIPAPHLDRYISEVDADNYPITVICSQANDAALTMGGGLILGKDGKYHVIDDDRQPQDIVPSELYLALLSMPGSLVMRPGKASWAVGAAGVVPPPLL